MNKLTKLAIVPFFALLACGDGGKAKNSDAGAYLDGMVPSKSDAAADLGGPAPDTAPVTTLDALFPLDARVPDAGPVSGPDGAMPDVIRPKPDVAVADAVVAADLGTPTPDTAIPPALDAGMDVAASPDVPAADTVVAVDTIAPGDAMALGDAIAANSDTSTAMPELASISPSAGNTGEALSLTLTGNKFESTAVVVFDGEPVATTVVSPTSISAQVPARLTGQAGAHAVLVSNGTNRESNRLYVNLVVPAGAPEILDYNPDNGQPGDTITLIGIRLAAEAITITGPGNVAATPLATGTTNWLTETMDTVKFVLPNGWQTGPIVVANSLGSSRGKIFSVGKNLTTLTGAVVQASSEYSSGYAKARGADNDLGTSWFSANYDCATYEGCTSVPWFSVTFPTAQTVSRIALRGNREYQSGYDFLAARIDVLGVGGTLWTNSYNLPDPNRDLDIVFAAPLPGVIGVKFTSLKDESVEPGFSELEVF